MPIREHPKTGTILRCDFGTGFCPPEMVKRRPVVVVSPKISCRKGLCTVVPLSTTTPSPIQPYHIQLDLDDELPPPLLSKGLWVKADMIYSVGFHRLDFYHFGKDEKGKRLYYYNGLSVSQLQNVQAAMLNGLGLAKLTKQLHGL